MKKIENNVIDLSSYGEIWDEDGDSFFESNLVQVFEFLIKEKLLENKEQKYIFLVSKISYKKVIERYPKEKSGTILKLLYFWEITFGEPFSEESLDEFHENVNFRNELYEKDAERKAAWGIYGMIRRFEDDQRKYQKAYQLPAPERDKEIKRLENRYSKLIIGG